MTQTSSPFTTCIAPYRLLLLAIFLVVALPFESKVVQADEKARALFAQYQPFIYQIRLFETASSSKSSIGSGFQVAGEDFIATNYHVVADAVYYPERYRIELLRSDGTIEALKIKDVDVIHDLALLERVSVTADIVQSVIHTNKIQDGDVNTTIDSVVTDENTGDQMPSVAEESLVEKAASLVGKAVGGVVGGVKDKLTGQTDKASGEAALNELTDLALAGQALSGAAPESDQSSDASPSKSSQSKVEKQAHILNGFNLANNTPQQGQAVLSMGNPRDLGMTVIEGTYNGLLPHSFYSRILFSGSINPGMSGGPAINNKGELVGINVATSGNQLSFLVPVKYLQRLIKRTKAPQPDIMKRIEIQLIENQQQLMSSILESNWPIATVGEVQVTGEMTSFIRCWGGADDNEKARYRMVYSRCFGDDRVYMARDFSTGMISYEFYWFESRDLNALQFYNRFEQSFSGASPSNYASEKHVGDFSCHDGFVLIPPSKDTGLESSEPRDTEWKSILCARPYKQFPDLYDVMLMAATVDQSQQGLIAHFSLGGVDKKLALDFTRRFMERISWK